MLDWLRHLFSRKPEAEVRLDRLEQKDREVRSQAAVAVQRANRVLAAADGFRRADGALKKR